MSRHTIESLVSLGLKTKRVSDTKGGEYHGPCIICGGTDRLTIRPDDPNSEHGFFICRKCHISGDMNKLANMLAPGSGNKTEINYKAKYCRRKTGYSWTASSKQSPSASWQNKMSEIVDACLVKQSKYNLLYSYLLQRNIGKSTIDDVKLFHIPHKMFVDVDGYDGKILVQEGIGIPNYRKGELYGVHIRQFSGEPKYVYVKGSVAVPYHLTKVDRSGAPVFIVESELDAVLIYQAAGDLVHAVALASVSARPDAFTDDLIKCASHVFVCLDYDPAGLAERPWWRTNYSQSTVIFSTKGKDIGDMGFTAERLREWVVSLIEKVDRKEPIVSRIRPVYQSYLLGQDVVAKQIESLKTAAYVAITVKTLPRSSKNNDLGIGHPVMIVLSVEDKVFIINKEEISVENLSGLKECNLVTYDALSQLSVLNMIGLDIENIECVSLMHSVYPQRKEYSLFDLAQMRTSYDLIDVYDIDKCDTTIFSGSERLEAFLINKIYVEQRLYIERPSLSEKLQLYRLMVNAVPAISQIQVYGLPFDWDGHERLVEIWKDALDNPGVASLLSPEQLKSRLSNWGDSLISMKSARTERIHAEFKFNGTVTGRITCSGPNLQGMPKDKNLRSLVHPPKGYVLVGADYSQIDVRVAAMLSGDEAMNRIFASGIDFHRTAAASLFEVSEDAVTEEQRNASKQATYAAMYGGASALYANMSKAFPQFAKWRSGQNRANAFLFTPSGRFIPRDFSKDNWLNSQINYPIQSTAADIMLAALGRLVANIKPIDAVIVHCIHDEILLDVLEEDAVAAAQALEDAMIKGFLDIFPNAPAEGLVTAKIGESWADVK